MLNDGSGFKKVYLATGFTDLRRWIDGLARIMQNSINPVYINPLYILYLSHHLNSHYIYLQ